MLLNDPSNIFAAVIAISLTLVWILLNSIGQAFFDIADCHLQKLKNAHILQAQTDQIQQEA